MIFFSALAGIFIDMSLYMLIGMTLAGILHEFLKNETVAKHLGQKSRFAPIKAALFGVPLPVCSCGVMPAAIFLQNSGASVSAVMSFLISAPQTGIDSFIATFGMMGAAFAAFRPLAAFVSGAAGGAVIQALAGGIKGGQDLPAELRHGECGGGHCGCGEEHERTGIADRIKRAAKYAYVDFIDDISVHFVIGLLAAAAVTAVFPARFFESLNVGSGIAGMLIMLAVGLPMYVCSVSSIPVAVSLMAKGFSPGAAFVFLFAGPATNAASFSVIIKRFGKKTAGVYLAVTAVFAVLFGLLFDGFLALSGITVNVSGHIYGIESATPFETAAAAVLGALLIRSLAVKLIRRAGKRKKRRRY